MRPAPSVWKPAVVKRPKELGWAISDEKILDEIRAAHKKKSRSRRR